MKGGAGPDPPGAPDRQAAPLHAEALAAIRATAFTRRRTRGGHTETAEYARRRGLVDVACCLASVMRDGLLRVSEAAALRWGDVELAGDGSGRIRIPESKTGQEAEGVVLYLGLAAVEALLAIRPEEAVIDAVRGAPETGGSLRSSTSTPTPSGGVCSRQRGRLGSPAGGTSPDTPGGLGWPRTCRLRASPSPS